MLDQTDKHVMSGSENGQVYVWDLVEGGCVDKLDHGGGQTVHSLAAHPTRCQLLTAARGSVCTCGKTGRGSSVCRVCRLGDI